MANQPNNKNQQNNNKSVAESMNKTDWSAIQPVHNNVEQLKLQI